MHAPILHEIRRATSADEPALWKLLTYAASMTEADAVAVARASPYLASYVEGFGTREGDWGLVAIGTAEPNSGAPSSVSVVGAAWLRLGGDRTDHAVATATEPELAIATVPEVRGKGLGARLLEQLFAEAPFDAIVLSVRSTNPSVRLYERHGFKTIRSKVNRVGGESLVMRRPR